MSLSLQTVTIVANKTNENMNEIILSQRLLDLLGLDQKKEAKIFIGSIVQIVKIRVEKIPYSEIFFSEQLLADLHLPFQRLKLQVTQNRETNSLYFGPVIGLLTDPPANQHDEPYFRSIHSFCEELGQRMAEMGGLFYVFSYKDFASNLAGGYCLVDGKWKYEKLPLPTVVYNRIHSRQIEQFKLFQNFRKKLDRLNIPFFNDRFLSKWEVHQFLYSDSKMQPYLPETKFFSKDHLFEFLEKYPVVFLKPVHGSQGKNIIKLSKKEKSFLLQYSSSTRSGHSVPLHSAEEIFKQLQPIVGKRIYIIQQGIPLVVHQTRPIDFRVLCHKTAEGDWQVTSIVARISGEEQIVSNLARGGEIVKPLKALRFFFSKKASNEILSSMKEFSKNAAKLINDHSDGITGELGIDIGVDGTGSIWLIEVNSKPSKNFEQPSIKIRPSTEAILRFCTVLAFGMVEKKED